MQVARWGEDLVVRLPGELVESLALQEGDEVEVQVKRGSEQKPAMTREEAMRRIAELRKTLPESPEGYAFTRREAYDEW